MADFRVNTSFFNHIKTKRLKRALGYEGIFALQKLWAYAAENKHDGATVYTEEDIDLVVDSELTHGEFARVLEDIGYLDKVDGGFRLHEWEEHNGYAATAKARGEKASAAANARWGKIEILEKQDVMLNDASGNAKVDNEHMLNHANGNAPSPSPSPSPFPSPTTDSPLTPQRGEVEMPVESENSKKPPCPHEKIIAEYHRLLPSCPSVREWGAASRKFLAARWGEKKDRQRVSWWSDAFKRVGESDFLMGRVRSRDDPFIFSLGWFVKASNFEKVINGNYENRKNNKLVPVQQRKKTANQQYMQEVGEFLEEINGIDKERHRPGVGIASSTLPGNWP